MGKTSIEWTDHTVNPIRARNLMTGGVGHYCEKVSSGCAHCYASRLQSRFKMLPFPGARSKLPTLPILTGDGTVQIDAHTELFLDQKVLASVARRKKPTKYFWGDMTDLFGSWVPDGWLVQILMTIYRTPWHTHQLLTKRPQRLADFLDKWNDTAGEDGEFHNARGPEATRQAHPSGRGQLFAAMLETMGAPPPGCAFPLFDWMEGPRWWPRTGRLYQLWVGTSIENQATADERIPHLLRCPAPVRFLSVEPLLGPIDLCTCHAIRRQRIKSSHGILCPLFSLDWVIAGGESGPQARPMHPEWVRSLRDQCQAAGVPFFFKQWGEWIEDRSAPIPEAVPTVIPKGTPAEMTILKRPSQQVRVVRPAGGDRIFNTDGTFTGDSPQQSDAWMVRVGKKVAGRLLDGVEHSAFPLCGSASLREELTRAETQ